MQALACQGCNKANVCVEQAANAGQSLGAITFVIDQSNNMKKQLAAAAASDELARRALQLQERVGRFRLAG